MEGRGSKGPAVCVTGGTGFLGSWLIMKLLHHGYHVHATIRHNNNNNKRDDGIAFLTDLPGAAENLKLFEADLDHPETFSAAIAGCSAVIHVATPALDFNNNQDHHTAEEAIVERSIAGTLGILKACLHHSETVKRVVYTSGTAAVVYNDGHDDEMMDESCWTDVEYGRRVMKNKFSRTLMTVKTLTERKAVEFAREHGLDLVTLIPSIVVGPFICAKFPASIRLALAMVFGEKDDGGGDVMMTEVSMVHVDDVARAYVFLLENPTAEGRYICSSSRLTKDQRDKLSAKYPDLAVPAMKSLKDIKGFKVPKISSRKLLDAGFEFEYDLDDMFDAAIKCCKTKCYL